MMSDFTSAFEWLYILPQLPQVKNDQLGKCAANKLTKDVLISLPAANHDALGSAHQQTDKRWHLG